MPELPEVETVRTTLAEKITGLSIEAVDILMPKIIRTPSPEEFCRRLTGQTILALDRRGKYLLVRLSGGLTLVIHLRMTGRLVYTTASTPPAKYTHVLFHLGNGEQLRFSDMRQFGRISLVENDALVLFPGLKDLGPEPLSTNFTREYLQRELRRRRTRLKPLLLDQTFIAGLGNIYADEALHRARLHPQRPASTLTSREAAALYRAIREVLTEGIAGRGTTFRDYVDGAGRRGGFQEKLRVYGRAGQPCRQCGKPVERIRISGRSAYFCPGCQKQ